MLLGPFCVGPRRGSVPDLAIERAAMDGFRDVVAPDLLASRQVGDGPGHFQNPVIGPRALTRVGHGHTQKLQGLADYKPGPRVLFLLFFFRRANFERLWVSTAHATP